VKIKKRFSGGHPQAPVGCAGMIGAILLADWICPGGHPGAPRLAVGMIGAILLARED
jgi:hypothetical protein